jgi:thymidine phosphorylase|tara:strand:- start:1310 stop:2629 length:1320 start_codon:yes stop_codon:yes gene_type:complete
MSNLIARLCTAIENGQSMEPQDLASFIEGVANRTLSIEAITVWLKAVHAHGASVEDTVALTKGMMHSGAVLSWDSHRPVADKHSTGGVGDKMSIMLAPALAACGVEVPMLAGRGLGHTGGTIDKLESIPGFNCALNPKQMQSMVNEIGCCIAAQNEAIAPADGLLYAIRDVTSTVDSIPLITASIVSKKAAEGLKALVLDVKCGRAAFMQTEQQAIELATSMVRTANGLGIQTMAQITDMNEPIGSHVGNALEIIESVEVLNGRGSKDTVNLVAMQGGALLHLLGKAESSEDGEQMIVNTLHDGTAAKRFELMCIAQGVTPATAKKLLSTPENVVQRAEQVTELKAKSSGHIEGIDAMVLAEIAREHGAGRFDIEGIIDPSVGFVVLKAKGDEILQGQPWIAVHHNQPLTIDQEKGLHGALRLSTAPVKPIVRLLKVIQ